MDLIFLEDCRVGERIHSQEEYAVRKEEVIAFAEAWDPQPFHVDEHAAAESIYGGLIACSAHIFAIFCRLSNGLGRRIAALGALGFDDIRLRHPLRPGDRVRLCAETVSVRRSRSRPDRGIVSSKIELTNQDGAVVFTAKSTYMVWSRHGHEGS